jgi:glycosyltransferase involved in cell wall biosynthesis
MISSDRKPAVSVVVPCFNGGRYIDQLLACLARQTDQDFEIVIVDDGSTEQATRDKLASLDPAIRVVHQSNSGPSAARNTGFREAAAPLVLTLDCDDTIEPQTIELLRGLLKDAPPDVAVAFSDMRLQGASEAIIPRNFNAFDLLFSNTLPSCVMLRKSAWQAVGGYDTEAMRDGYEDWEFYLHLALAGFRGRGVPHPLYNYRVASGGLLFSQHSQLHSDLWRRIRAKHHQAYKLPAILLQWWSTRDGSGRVTLLRALSQYAAARCLPDSWFNHVIITRRRRRLLGPEAEAAGSGSQALSVFLAFIMSACETAMLAYD